MKKEHEMLKEWAINYIKNKDILLRTIESIDENKEGWDFIANTKAGKSFYLIVPRIEDFGKILSRLSDERITLVVLNTRQNLETVSENWDTLKLKPRLSIIFANPESQMEKKWVVFPHIHDRVTEKASLKRGLKSMFDTVDEWKK